MTPLDPPDDASSQDVVLAFTLHDISSGKAMPTQHEKTWRSMGKDHFTELPVVISKKHQTLFVPQLMLDPAAGLTPTNVVSLSCLALDFDRLDAEDFEALRRRLSKEELQHLWHFSYSCFESFAQKGFYKFRLIFPLSRPVLARQWSSFWLRSSHAYADFGPDPACKNLTRGYYIPGVPTKEVESWYFSQYWQDG